MLGEEPALAVLGCCSWLRGKVNLGNTTKEVLVIP
jgi:hypothetical protein